MGRLTRFARTSSLAVCLFLFVTSSFASKCTVGCHGMHPSKSYEEGKTYIYDLEGSSLTTVTDAQSEATLKLKATVELFVKPDCVRQLRLKNVQVNGAPVSAKDLEQHALQFNYHDGHIDTEVCAEPGDSQASLNIKRAVISMFQSAVLQESGSTTYHETDVFGGCPTDFNFHKDGDSIIVQKHRNLGQCSHRENLQEGLISSTFNIAAGIKSSPLLGSHQRIEQRFKRGILNKAASTEIYKYRPFSNGEAGLKTTVEMILTLKGDKSGDSPAPVSESKSLIFEAPHPVVKSSVDAIDKALAAVKAEETDSVKSGAAQRFSDFVRVLRVSSKKDILAVYNKVKGSDDKKIVLDGLYRAGTGEAAEVAVELIKSKEIEGMQSLMYCASLALIRHVNLASLSTVTSLLDEPDIPRVCYLGVGQVIGKYCQEHNCENTPEVKEAVHKIREKVGNGKAKTRDQENQVVFALKALGNSKFLDDATLQKLANMVADKNVRNRVRVAAIEALPSRCSMKWKTILLKVLADREEDSEIRIKSYLSLVDCACPQVANQLKEILDKETVNQVGSFITSHLRNLRASADVNKQHAKQQLENIRPKTKFPEDFRKFSFNNELSYNIDAFGVGSALESNVIYSQNSFVPRSTSLNLTAEIFGRSFNFLELDARIENLDRIIEHYFGPKGVLRNSDLKEMKEEGEENVEDLVKYAKEKFASTVRGKREVKLGELDRFAKGVHLRNNEVDQDLDVDLSMKLFGTELAYLSYHGDTGKLTPKMIIDKLFAHFKKVTDKAKNFHYNFENHLQFLDAELVYPTGMGIPMSLGVVGSGVAHFKTHGKIDVESIIKDPSNAALQFAIEPSASISIVGTFLLKGFNVESGMKIVTTLHTSTGSDVSVKVLDGRGVDVNFGVPKKKQEIISASSEILFTSGPKGDKYVAPKLGKNKEYSDCFDQFSTLLGLTVCGQVSFPYEGIESIRKKPLFPLSGPAKFAFTVENNDVSSYHFKTYYDAKDPKKRSLEILLETPNSRTNRHISLLVEGALEPNKYVKVSFDSPIKKASAEAVLKNTPQERSLTITVDHDKNQYFARAGLVANGNKYKPVLEYKVPEHIEKLAGSKAGGKGGQLYNLDGVVDVIDQDGGKKYVFDKVNLVSNNRKLIGVDGFLLSTPNVVGMDMNLIYGEESLAVKLNAKRLGEKNYELLLSAVPSRDPSVGFSLKWDYHKQPNEFTHNLVFVHGPDPNSEKNRFTLSQKAVYNLDPKDFLVSGSNDIKYSALGLVFELEGKLTPNSVKGEIDFKFDKFKAGSGLSAKKSKAGDYELEFEAKVLDNALDLKAKRTVLEPHKSKFENSLVLSPGGKYTVNGVVTHDVKPNDVNVQVDGDADLNGKKIKLDTGVEANPQKVHSRAVITVDGVKYVDFLLKVQRGGSPNGNLNLNLKDYLNVLGQFTYQNGKGNAHINVDIPKINRKIKGNADLTVSGTQHAANAELLYDAEKDPSKRIKLSTVSDFTKTNFDTKNVFEILTHKFEVNAKGKLQGTFTDGSQSVDADVSLPNGHYIVYKMKRSVTKKGKVYEGGIDNDLTYYWSKGGKSSKFIYIGNAKDFNPEEGTYHLNYNFKTINMDGKDVQLIVDMKNLPGAEYNVAGMEVDLSGSLISMPIHVGASADYNKHEGKYKLKAGGGDAIKIEGHGKIVRGNQIDKPSQFEAFLDAKTSSEKLRNIKVEIVQSLLVPLEKGAHFDFKHSGKIVYNDDKTLKLDAFLNHDGFADETGKGSGKGALTLGVLKHPALSIESSYKHDPSAESKKGYVDFGVGYGDKKATLALDANYLPDLSTVNVGVKATTPVEKMRNIDFQLEHKREKDGVLRRTNIVGTVDGAKYTVHSEIQVDPTEPIIHLISTCPNGKTELLFKYKKLGEREYAGEWKLDTPKGFVTAAAKINLEDSDNFVINVNFDSDKLQQRKIQAEIANKPTAKAGRRIVITVTSDGKNIVTGSTNYKKHDEDGKVIFEGNGSLKIGENTRSSSFKYTRQQLTREVDGEVGVAVVLNANFGPSAVVGEMKFSNKEVHVFNSYCEQSKDCAHYKLQAALDTDHKTYVKHQITVEVDLKKFNVPVEFGLKTSTEYKDLMFDHTTSLYLHSTKDKSQYTYQFYIHPKESASILTLPSREMAFIVTFDLPKTRQTGAYKLDISHYLDRKNKPNDKTSLTVTGDVNIDKSTASVNGEAKFTYPNQPKEMVVKGRLHYGGEHLLDGNVDVDIFSKKSQKISVVAKLMKAEIPKGYNISGVVEINSRGQQLKVELKEHIAISPNEFGVGSLFSYTDQHQKPKTVGFLFSINPKEGHLLVMGPNKELIKSDAKMEFSKNLQKIEGEVSILGDKPHVMNFEAKDWQNFDYVHYVKGAPNSKLAATGQVVLGQLAEAHADVYKDGNKKNLFHVLIHLDEDKFLKPYFGYNKDNIVGVVDHYRNRAIETVKQLKDVSGDIGEEVVVELKDLVEHLKKAQPNLKPLVEYYQNERNKIREELHADATVKEIQATLNSLFGGIITAVTETMKQVAQNLEELYKQFTEIVSKLTDAMKAVYPELKESYNKLFHVAVEVLDAAANLALTYFKAILNLINEHHKELKELATVGSELIQDIAKILFKGFGQIRKELQEFVTLLVQQIKALPIFDLAKEKYQELLNFEIPEAILSPIEEVSNAIKVMLPTEELREFFEVTYDYIMKHVRRQKVDDANEIKKIYSHAVAAIQSVVALMQSQITFDNVFNIFETQIPIDFSLLTKLPGIATLKISVLNLLKNRELPSPLDLYYTYRPTLYLTDIVPPFSKTGTVIEGGHFFTFDGRHFTMPGSCDYVLAQDMKDGNFSVVANFNNGVFNSITVTEPKESITLKAEGKLLVNGKPADYPASTKNLHAFLIKPIAGIKSDYGVQVMCHHKTPLICTVRVSGFYLGRLRGLLGDANNEPFDDYTLPPGKITESETEFGNAYKVKADCPAATAVDHHAVQRAPICTQYFSGNSPMSGCFNYVKPNDYRDACDHAVSASTPQGPCLIASAYFAACHKARVHVDLPTDCANCEVGANKVNIGDSFSVKIPKKEADIIFVVEQDVKNEKVFQELITPLMSELRNELKQQGVTDVHIGLIGYGETMKWPQHYTVNGHTNIEGEVKNMKFEKKDEIITMKEAKEGDLSDKVKYLDQRFDVEFGTFKLTDAYEEAIRYPFRPGAAKAVIGVLSTPCEKSPFPVSLQQLRLLVGQKIYRDLGLTYYHISFPDEIFVSGKPQKNIVGWDHDSAYTFADSKKKPVEGSTELREGMRVTTPDVCADFAISSGGVAFSSNNFLEAKPNQKKQYIQVAARRVAEGLVDLEIQEDCVCTQHHGLYGRSSCKIVGRKEKGALARHTKGTKG